MHTTLFKIGDLARRTGLTVRALHHYDAIGLLSPSVRTTSGARRYGPQDVVRLHRIQAMKQLGYALPAIKATLDDTGVDPIETMRRHIQVLEAKAQQARMLSHGLQTLMNQLTQGQPALPADWLDSLEMMAIYQNHFVEAEVQALCAPQQGGARSIERLWAQLVAEVDRAMSGGLPADGPHAHALAWRWVRLVIARTRNDPQLAIKLRALQSQDLRAQAIVGITPAMMDWVGQAIALARTELFAKYLTPAQASALKVRQLRSVADPDRWPALMAKFQQQLDAAAPVSGAAVQALAHEWQRLFRESYCGDDSDMAARVRTALANEPDLMLGVGVTESLMAYVRQAMVHLVHQPTDR